MSKWYNYLGILGIFGIICIIISLVLYYSDWGKGIRNNEVYSITKDSSYSDVIDSVGYDKMDHNSPKLFLHSQQSVDLSFLTNKEEIMAQVSSGDSIYKEKGKMEIILVSKNERKKIHLMVYRLP